jgi:uncharacterized cupredoxin-like copper-binding protein
MSHEAKTLYDRLGGYDAITAVANDLLPRLQTEMEHDDPNATRVAPKKTDEIVWNFTKLGEFSLV